MNFHKVKIVATLGPASDSRVRPLKTGELFMISAGLPLGKGGTTNLLLIQRFGVL